jgi:hypothetical protein
MSLGSITPRFGRASLRAILSVGCALALLSPTAADADQPEKIREQLEKAKRLKGIVEEDLNANGACPWDIAAKAAELGAEIGPSFQFVRDAVRFEAYEGLLRGARGVLVSRSGNALDKSLLLKALLEESGHTCRLVGGTLSVEKALVLVRQFLSADPLKGPWGEFTRRYDVDEEALRRFSERSGLDLGALKKEESEEGLQAKQADERLWKTVQEYDALLETQLKEAQVQLGMGFEAWTKALAERAIHHVWAQAPSHP